MIEHYKIESTVTGRSLKVSYKNGKFFKLEKLKGAAFTPSEIQTLGVVLPATTDQIPALVLAFPKIDYTKIVKEQSIYQQYVSAWHLFYNEFMDMPPRFSAVDGKHLKQIIAYLTNVEAGEKEGLVLFKVILDNWKNLDDFHKENTDLKYINSRINPILNATKRTAAAAGGTGNGARL